MPAICDSLSLASVVLLNISVASALESQNRKPDHPSFTVLVFLTGGPFKCQSLSG